MTALDDLPFLDGRESPLTPTGARGLQCRRHHWVVTDGGGDLPTQIEQCANCNRLRERETSRRGRTARNRGNAFEREVAAKLGGRRVGQYGDKTDVDVPGWLRVQCKVGSAYPERLDGWLRSIPAEAGILRAVVLGDAPGSSGKRRTLIVLDFDDFADWYGRP
jgi:hypothetical protein